MKVSLTWLKDYVEIPDDLSGLCDRLDMTGTGVEGIEQLGDQFKRVVVGQIREKIAHPNSDHMWVCRVDVGEANLDDDGHPALLQIVCGAQNFEAGDKVPVALVGAEFGDFKIKKSKLRGVESCGMNCSERELGLGSNHEGIMILDPDAPVGEDFARYLGRSDTVLDLEITPNRPDCLSVIGLARELGAIYRVPYSSPLSAMAAKLTDYLAPHARGVGAEVTIVDADRCPRYSARVIRGVTVGPSPDWLVERLAAIGQRSINNVVDVTNYILYLFGQPLHAFDYDQLLEGEDYASIVVRPAEEGERFTTLDGEERILSEDMTVIATPTRAVALAGVMGGLDSEVTDETVNILLEAATFSPAHTSRTSRNLGLISESSLRYERRVDDRGIDLISAAAAVLLAELSGGVIDHDPLTGESLVDVWPLRGEIRQLSFRVPRFCAMMGADIPETDIRDILGRLGCVFEIDPQKAATPGLLKLFVPSFRPDLEREIDLYEEVLRLYGMERVAPTLPGGRGRVGVRSFRERVVSVLHHCLTASGLNETMTYAFAENGDAAKLGLGDAELGLPVELINPINADQSTMRRSVIPNLLHSVAHNQNHGVDTIQLYEIGDVFIGRDGKRLPKERTKLAGVLVGAMGHATWNNQPTPFDFFDGKGVVENIARELAFEKFHVRALDEASAPQLQPGRAAEVFAGGIDLGWLGEIHPRVIENFDIDGVVVAFELDLDAILKATRTSRPFEKPSSYPTVKLDVAFVVDEDVTHEQLVARMRGAGGKLLAGVRLFDVYRDAERLGASKKSMAYALSYRALDRTLTSEEAERAHQRLIKKVCAAVGAELRS